MDTAIGPCAELRAAPICAAPSTQESSTQESSTQESSTQESNTQESSAQESSATSNDNMDAPMPLTFQPVPAKYAESDAKWLFLMGQRNSNFLNE
jgi:hypothetical protein